ncbi:MAG: glycosyltransferase family 2 protein [Planctomycetes bacterium]|nr:glycosyltransferase family 2 protein [Planctomycetota bacterium]
MTEQVLVSVVMPCLNEERSVGVCTGKAMEAFRRLGVAGEVVVVDNGSTDRSTDVAAAAGARIVREKRRGYGAALRRGIREARGRYVIMGDSDDSYDFSDLAKFVRALQDGADLVMGSRLRGTIHAGAMPRLHRRVGTPVLTAVLNFFYKTGISDVNCGMRGFRKDAIEALDLRCDGMEFASEMVIKAAIRRLAIREAAIDYYPTAGGRVPHLKTFSDGWRHLRFMLILRPKYLFIYPGLALFLLGAALMVLLEFGDVVVFGVPLGISTAIFAGALIILGMQIAKFGVYAKILGARGASLSPDDRITRFLEKHFTLEKGLVAGAAILAAGLALGAVTAVWLYQIARAQAGVHVGVTKLATLSIIIIILGIQTIFASFYLSLLDLERTLK